MHLEIQRKLFSRSERVKSVDFHPTEPWLITGLYNGSVNIYNHQTGAIVKTFEVSQVPVRCVRFIARKNWFVAGSDDYHLRVFNYNTHDKVVAFEAHPDYIRCLAVHPTLSLVFTASDDMMIKSWDWEKGWKNMTTFVGHTHYIMGLAFNPKDANTFASACLDKSVKVWSITNPHPNYTFDAHEKGVNSIEYYHGPDKPYVITTGDDRTVKVWDYLSKTCIQTLEGHTSNVSFAVYHPTLPIIVSGSEDGSVKIWHANTYRLEQTLNYGLERAWCVAINRGTGNDVAIGYDEGVVVIKLGRDEPSYSMDSSGKLVFTRGSEVLSVNLQAVASDIEGVPDGTRLPVGPREMGSIDNLANAIIHSPNGRFVTVVGDGEYVIYTALAWRNKSFGQGSSFAWAEDSNTYAVLEGKLKIRLYRNFKERKDVEVKGAGSWGINGLHSGILLAGRGSGFVVFWDWETGEIVRRVDVEATNIFWSGSGTLVAIVAEDSFYILRFDRAAYDTALQRGADFGDEGVEEAFEVVAEIPEGVRTARWAGDCFIYTNSANRLNYLVGSETSTVTNFDSPLYILGYMPAQNKVYLVDKDVHIYAYSLSLAVVEYQTAILRGDMDAAEALLPQLPQESLSKVSRFLESHGHGELALNLSPDPDHRFELALTQGKLDIALRIAEQTPEPESHIKWKALGDYALSKWQFKHAQTCFQRGGDIAGMFLVAMALGQKDGLSEVAKVSKSKRVDNIAFAAHWASGDAKGALDVLIDGGRGSEAALLARSYRPSEVSRALSAWKTEGKGKAGLADPNRGEESELFEEGWAEALQKEEEIYGAPVNGIISI